MVLPATLSQRGQLSWAGMWLQGPPLCPACVCRQISKMGTVRGKCFWSLKCFGGGEEILEGVAAECRKAFAEDLVSARCPRSRGCRRAKGKLIPSLGGRTPARLTQESITDNICYVHMWGGAGGSHPASLGSAP